MSDFRSGMCVLCVFLGPRPNDRVPAGRKTLFFFMLTLSHFDCQCALSYVIIQIIITIIVKLTLA